MSKLIENLKAARMAGVPLLAIVTQDQPATVDAISTGVNGCPQVKWDCINGLVAVNEEGKAALAQLPPRALEDSPRPVFAFRAMLHLPPKTMVFAYNGNAYLGEPPVVQAIQNLREPLKENKRTLLLLGSNFAEMPQTLQADVVTLEEKPPTEEQLSALLADLHESAHKPLDPAALPSMVDAVRGLPSLFTSEQVIAMSFRKNGLDMDTLWERKESAINATKGLHISRGGMKYADLAGMDVIMGFLRSIAGSVRVVLHLDEIEKALAGSSGDQQDTSGVSSDFLGVLLKKMENLRWKGAILAGVPGCQPEGSKVLMANGLWQPIETVQLGDVVLSPQRDGTVTRERVEGRSSYLDRPLYTVSMKNKAHSYRCSADHILPHFCMSYSPRAADGSRRLSSKYRELTVEEYRTRSEKYRNKARIFTTPAYDLPERDLPVDPYVLGAFLGDGSWTATASSPRFHSASPEVVAQMRERGARLSDGVKDSRSACYTYSLSGVALGRLGLRGKRAAEKEIPSEYMTASLTQRLALLAGLIDTDGTADEFSSVSAVLARQFLHLTHSVGGFATIRLKEWRDSLGRQFKTWRVLYKIDRNDLPLALSYKRGRNTADWRDAKNHSFDVREDGRGTVYGLRLSGASQCYITDDFVVTHNSGKTALSEATAGEFGVPRIEMDFGGMKDKWVGSSEGAVRAAFDVIEALGGKDVLVLATCNKLNNIPPELRRRFTLGGVWYFDVPTLEEQEPIKRIYEKKLGLAGQEWPDTTGYTGAEIRNLAELAVLTKSSLKAASAFIVPVSVSDPESVVALRKLAEGRFLSVARPGRWTATPLPQKAKRQIGSKEDA